MAKLSALIKATRNEIFDLLTDYQNYADWTADVIESTVLAQEGDIVVAEFVSPELMTGKYVLEFVHSKPHSIVYKQVDQYASRGLKGSWHLADSPAGEGIIVTGTLNLKTGVLELFSNRKKVHLILQRRLDAMSQLFPDASSAKAGKSTVVRDESVHVQEVFASPQREEEFTVWLLGHKYYVKKVR